MRSAIINGCAPENETDIEDLAGLQRGYLSESQPPISLSKIKRNRLMHDQVDPAEPGDIIDFPRRRSYRL